MSAVKRPDVSEAGSVAEDVATSTLSAAGGVLLGVALGLWFLVRHPRLAAVLVSLLASFVLFGALGLAVTAAALAVGGMGWRQLHRSSFDRLFLGAWLRPRIYSRAISRATMRATAPHAPPTRRTGSDP